MFDSPKNREVICIQSGQAGVQLGHAMWELLTVEHNLNSNGIGNDIDDKDLSFLTFFSQTSDKQCFPRSLIFDTEPTVIDEIRCGYYRKLFHPEFLITGYEDAANNFARGFYALSKPMMCLLVERIRDMIEHCDNFQGFLVQSSTAGGTGSGLLTALMEYLVIEFAGRTSVQLSIFPGTSLSNCIVQPYNCLLTQEKLVYCADLNIIVDNEELYNICCNQLDVIRPSFSNINRVISPILSGLTAPIRFKGLLNSDLSDISTNLIPFPRLHFPFVSYAPLMSSDKSDHDQIDTESLTRSMFLKENQFVNADLQNGYFMSSAILYRGNCDLSNILRTIQDVKADKNLHWVDWCPTGFKISHTVQMPVSLPSQGAMDIDKSAMMLSNHNGIIPTFRSLEIQFKILLKRRAYVHWYVGEGMEESEFQHALYEVETISDDYLNIVDRCDTESAYVTSATSLKSNLFEDKITDDSDKGIARIETKSGSSSKKDFLGTQDGESKHVVINVSEATDKSNEELMSNNKSNTEKDNKFINADEAEKSFIQYLSNNNQKFYSLGNDISTYKNVLSSYNEIKVDKNASTETFNDSKTVSYPIVKTKRSAMLINSPDQFKAQLFSNSNTLHSTDQDFQWSTSGLKSKLNRQDYGNESIFGSNKASDEIFEICERNYIQNNFKTLNKKRILRQTNLSVNKDDNHFIKKIYLKNKSMLHKIMHIEQYDVTKPDLS